MQISEKMEKKYVNNNRSRIMAHFDVSLTENSGEVKKLIQKLVSIAKSHPQIGIGKVKVPSVLMLMLEELSKMKQQKPYLSWREYETFCTKLTDILKHMK
jgi:hypothetical protein